MKEHVDVDHLTVNSASSTEGVTIDDVIVVVNQAYGPDGEKLIGVSDETFDGFPAISLKVKAGELEGLVHLSPIHGDARKAGLVDIPRGTKCELSSPVTGKPLDRVGSIDGSDAHWYAIYLSTRLADGPAVYVSDTWGHFHSRIVDNNELISHWAAVADGESTAGDEGAE